MGLKQLLAANCPIAYGTQLYRGSGAYRGDPSVYVGAPPVLTNANGQPMGHSMLIVGYDDTKAYDGGTGAFSIQNSDWMDWGATGYVWMAYATISALAQPIAFYYQEPG